MTTQNHQKAVANIKPPKKENPNANPNANPNKPNAKDTPKDTINAQKNAPNALSLKNN